VITDKISILRQINEKSSLATYEPMRH